MFSSLSARVFTGADVNLTSEVDFTSDCLNFSSLLLFHCPISMVPVLKKLSNKPTATNSVPSGLVPGRRCLYLSISQIPNTLWYFSIF